MSQHGTLRALGATALALATVITGISAGPAGANAAPHLRASYAYTPSGVTSSVSESGITYHGTPSCGGTWDTCSLYLSTTTTHTVGLGDLSNGGTVPWPASIAPGATATLYVMSRNFWQSQGHLSPAVPITVTRPGSVTPPPVPGGGLVTTPGYDYTMDAGTTKKNLLVPVQARADLKISDGTLALTAPSGTTFTPGQTTLQGRYTTGSNFESAPWLNAVGEVSADGRTFIGVTKGAKDTTIAENAYIAWQVSVDAAPATDDGTGTLGQRFVGSSNLGSFNVAGTSRVAITGVTPPTPIDGSFDPAGVGTPATVPAGTVQPVHFGATVTEKVTGMRDTKVVLTAPRGTAFPEGATTLTGEYASGGGWKRTDSLRVTGSLSADRTTFTGTMPDSGHGFELPTGYSVRWSVPVAAPDDATSGAGDLGFTVTTTVGEKPFRITGASRVTVEQSVRPITAKVDSVDDAARTAAVSGTATKEAEVRVGNTIIAKADTDGNWSGTVTNLVVGKQDVSFAQYLRGEEVDDTTIPVEVKQLELAPVTVTTRTVSPGEQNTITGTGEPGATFRVLKANGKEIAPGAHVVGIDGTWSFDHVVAAGSKRFRFVIEQSKYGQTVPSELFTVPADTK
ncbi:hypothetical protein [Curtobacterium sp. ZW137]|uniref:hypothetical protein n=1 Tax=Curtobacterium sp. ZW137 TaxID=2485104 RepID=UPI000F4B110D|nr:hypothetical protein [Curtobacterium sp. ZW137]ROP65152.1 hypothetical protein EDF55_1806 [Curtobacterium sp. ZW137]